MTAHNVADHFDIRGAIAGEDLGDIPEVGRSQQTGTDDREETGVRVAAVSESVDHATRDEEGLAGVQVGARSADGKRSGAVQPEDGLIELIVAVRRGHACVSGYAALEDAHTAAGLVGVDVETDGESADLDRLGGGVRHGRSLVRACWRNRERRRQEDDWRDARERRNRSQMAPGQARDCRRSVPRPDEDSEEECDQESGVADFRWVGLDEDDPEQRR
jgi:hypothetical protein